MVDETKKKQSSDGLNKNEYKKFRNLYTNAMNESGQHGRYIGNLNQKDLTTLLSYKDDDSVFGTKLKAGQIRELINDINLDKVKAKPQFGKKDGGVVRKGDSEAVQMYKDGGEVKKKKSKVAGRLAQRGYGKARK